MARIHFVALLTETQYGGMLDKRAILAPALIVEFFSICKN